jgi:meso-butanediol dehydrogenase / (S,S)-butanediol dehydrogenase / diacetyl reductase
MPDWPMIAPSKDRLAGKRVLITGTGGGQGAAAQELFAREGARVVGCDVKEGSAESTADDLANQGLDVIGRTVDLADPETARDWVDWAGERLGGIDVLYNNAAGFAFAPYSEMTLEQWRHSIDTELNILFHVTHPAWPYLTAGGGSVINTASISAIRGIAPMGQVAHGATKAGVVGFTRSLAAEGGPSEVRVNAISPGFVVSPATEEAVDDATRDYIVGMHLIERAGEPIDIARMALFLASDESTWITGQNISVDGGWSAGFR